MSDCLIKSTIMKKNQVTNSKRIYGMTNAGYNNSADQGWPKTDAGVAYSYTFTEHAYLIKVNLDNDSFRSSDGTSGNDLNLYLYKNSTQVASNPTTGTKCNTHQAVFSIESKPSGSGLQGCKLSGPVEYNVGDTLRIYSTNPNYSSYPYSSLYFIDLTYYVIDEKKLKRTIVTI